MDTRYKGIDILTDEVREWKPTHWEHPISCRADYITMEQKWVAAKEEQIYGPKTNEGIQIWVTHVRYLLM